MTDEGSVPPNSVPVPETPPGSVQQPMPAPSVESIATPVPEPLISTEAVKEMSATITEAVKDAVMGESAAPTTEPPQQPVHNSEVPKKNLPQDICSRLSVLAKRSGSKRQW